MIADLFRKIEEVYPSITGWCSLQRAEELACMVVALRPNLSCCVGVWGGRETIVMALAHQAIGCGKVLAVDPWAAAASVQGQDGANEAWWAEQAKHDVVYDAFIAKVNELGLNGWIDIRRNRSDGIVVPPNISVIVIDGNHGPQAVEDVQRYTPSVPIGGFVYFDDLHWSGGHVEKAAELAVQLGFQKLHSRDTGAFFQRVR